MNETRTDDEPLFSIDIYKVGGSFYAFAKRSSGAFWGLSQSGRDVPELLRNTAEILEAIHEMRPQQFPHLFDGRETGDPAAPGENPGSGAAGAGASG